MKVRLGAWVPLILAVSLLAAAAACSRTPTSQPVTLPTAPAVQPAAPLSASELMAMDTFAKEQQAIGQEWDKLHEEFDLWRAGLISCHRSSVHVALRDFAASFNNVTEEARELPRASHTRELADMLIAAAEGEETAFRQLRDRWQPNNVALFEVVETRRSETGRAQKGVEDLAIELRERFEKIDAEEVEEFSESLDVIGEEWDQIHDDYADLRRGIENLGFFEAIASLEQLIARFDALVETIDEVPSAEATEDMAEMLLDAAKAELEVLLALHEAMVSSAVPAPDETGPQSANGSQDSPPPAGDVPDAEGADASPAPMSPTFDDMDAKVDESESVLEETGRTIKEILEEDPAEKLAELEDFSDGYDSLLVEWDAFYQRYNGWRRSEGGCDRTEVLQALDRFNLRAREIGRNVRDLPQSSYLLPVYSLLVEAAEREEGAIRALRNSWQPFTVDAFIAVEQERANAARLRRQASAGLQGLSERGNADAKTGGS